MRLEQSVELSASPQAVWAVLADAERIAPCLPGAVVGARNADGSHDGEFRVKIGPTSAAYSGRVQADSVNGAAHAATLTASGTDQRGQGGARATVIVTLGSGDDGGTRLEVVTDYQITGRLARFGRGGTIEEILSDLIGEFADNLRATLAGDDPTAPAPDSAAPVPHDDPDAVLEGAMPIAGALADEPVVPDPAPADRRPSEESPPATVARRVRENPAPLVALVVGFLVALRVLRRRG